MNGMRLLAAVTLLVLILPAAEVRRLSAQQAPAGAGAQGAARPDAGQPPVQAPPGGQAPTIRGGIDFVRVDVFATDNKGNPITDLKQSDFEVIEDNAPQTIEQFRVVNIERRSVLEPLSSGETRSFKDEEVRNLEDDSRLIVFFLDDYHTRDRNAIAVRDTLIRFIENQVRPTDLLAIMYPLSGLDDVAFTRNHESIITAISRFEGRKYNYIPRNQAERELERQRASTMDHERMRNRIVQGALEGLAMKMGSLRDERKTVVFVSEGFTVSLPPEMRRAEAAAPQLGTPIINPDVEKDQEIKGQMDLDLRMREVYRALNRFNTSVYALDPRGLTPFEFDINDGSIGGVSMGSDRAMLGQTQDTLKSLAEESDGRAILNTNALREGLEQMLKDSSFYYLLGYSANSKMDGKFHQIKVRVKRPGVNIRARKGYWALTPEIAARAAGPRTPEVAAPITQALDTLASPVKAARYVRTWIGSEQGSNGKTRVTVVWEPLPPTVGLRSEQAGRVTLLAATEKGDLIYRGRSPDATAGISAEPPKPNGPAANVPQKITFEAPPGKMDLRMTIEAAAGGTLDNDNRFITVPDLSAPLAGLSTPRVFRGRTARDIQAALQDPAATPTAAREFSRAERLLIRFDAYAASGDKPTVTAAVLNRTGQKVYDATVAAAAAGGTHQIELGLNSMAAGDYVLEVTAKSATGESATELVAFRVGA